MREAREALEVIEAYLKTWSPISSSHKYHAQDILAAKGCGKEFKCWADVSIWYAAEAIEPSPPPGGGG